MKSIAVVLVSLLVVACHTTPTKDAGQTSQTGMAGGNTSVGTVDQGQTADNKLTGQSQNPSIYFDYAKSVVAPDYNRAIQQEAQSIKGNKHSVVTVEGNCDERGSAEYNLGLGQRRADAVKKLLVAAGVHARQIRATSLGKEKPRATCHDESCWKENRRVDFVQG